MSKNKQVKLFTKRFASLLLTQSNNKYLKSRALGFKTSGEIIASEKFSTRQMDWWKVNEAKEPCACDICSSHDEREVT